MQILFMGRIPTYRWDDDRPLSDQEQPFVRAGHDLGYEAARRGHTLILSDDHISAVDTHAMEGVVDFVKDHPGTTVDVVVNRTEGSDMVFADLPPEISIRRHFHTEVDREIHGTGSLIPNLASLDTSDAAILIGGGRTTRLIGSIGADRDAKIVAIPSFGGASQEVYEKLKYTYKAFGKEHPGLTALNSVWADTSAGHIIDLAEAMLEEPHVEKHSYFMSYRWANVTQADHVEALLLRSGRTVLRDESMFRAGENLSDTIKSMIGAADTYLALHSSGFDKSDFCRGELGYAVRRNSNGERPHRVVMLAIESYDPNDIPIEHGDRLWKPGVERFERDLAIRQLIEQETNA